MVAKQAEMVRKAVDALENHPAVLVWCLGNEAEGYGAGDDPAYWRTP